jgi:adenylate cyclase
MERKLAAILSADVKGYSRLMGADEESTVRTLTAYREMMAERIRAFRGRVVDSPGDNLLAEFASVVDCLRCAVDMQERLAARNAGVPPVARMEFRMGVNLGDVVVEGERIYGDGVNIAARLEEMADAGGICISGTVYDQVEEKLDLDYEYVGEQTVKNISKPVRVYRVHVPRPAAGEAEGTAAPRPSRQGNGGPSDRPSIAVLPFVNISGDPEQEYFSDGLTEDLIIDLSKVSGLFVIARNSAFRYKGRPVRIEDVGRDLGVRYVLEGSVRKAGERVRISAQLLDTATGYHVWAERYDRELRDIFALQDDVTQKIVGALQVKLTPNDESRLGCGCPCDVDAYDCCLRGVEFFHRLTKECNAQARRLFEDTLERDPNYALAYAYLARTYNAEWGMMWTDDRSVLDRAFALAKKAVALDPGLAVAHAALAHVYLWRKHHDEAVAAARTAVALNPNDADAHATLAEVLSWSGRHEEASEEVRQALRLNPHPPPAYLATLARVHMFRGRNREAAAVLREALEQDPGYAPAHFLLALVHASAGRADEARAEAVKATRRGKRLSVERLRERLPYKDEAALDRTLARFREAVTP